MSATQGGIYSVLDDPRINAREVFFRSLGQAFDGSWARLVGGDPMSSNTEVEMYKDIGSVPQLSAWEGEPRFEELPTYGGALRNIEFFAGLLVQKADLRRDKIGRIQQRIAQLGPRASTHWEKLLSNLIINAETDGSLTIGGDSDLTSQAYDGQAFFDTDHSFTGSKFTTAQTNDLAVGDYASIGAVSTAAAPTASEAAAFITDILGHFWTLKDDQGEPSNGESRRFLIMVGTNQLFSPISAAFGLQAFAAGESSKAYGMVNSLGLSIDLRLNPRLSANTTKVYVFNTDGTSDKPFILQEETPLQIAEDAGTAFDKAVKVGVWGTRNAGFGNWQRALVATLS
jgi:phage major head subunit gpT-like protein